MPVFATPNPISAEISLSIGDVRVTATDRDDTVVEVQPTDPAVELDRKAATQTKVDFQGARLTVTGPKSYGLFGKTGSVDVTVELPAASHVHSDAAIGDVRCDGEFGQCWVKTAAGNITVGEAKGLKVKTSSGRVTVDHVAGDAEINAASGDVRVGWVEGAAEIKNSNGDTFVGEVTGNLRCNSANGDISVDRALATVNAKTANGRIQIGEVVRGEVVLNSASGSLAVGVREGTAAWLDVQALAGRVRNTLDTADGPEDAQETVEVRARTYSGDIVISRSKGAQH